MGGDYDRNDLKQAREREISCPKSDFKSWFGDEIR